MKRFKDLNLTHTEWEEVFSFPKVFNVGDIVECGHSEAVRYTDMEKVWEVVAVSLYKKGEDNAYQLKNLISGKLEWFSSTFIQPLGTFVDDSTLIDYLRRE